MLTGNLADITFDGQSAITQRGLRGRGCHYIGNARWIDGEDRPDLTDEAGRKPQFLALAPWVVPEVRARVCARSARNSSTARAAESRTTTWRPRWSPTCRSRPIQTGRDARRPNEVLGRLHRFALARARPRARRGRRVDGRGDAQVVPEDPVRDRPGGDEADERVQPKRRHARHQPLDGEHGIELPCVRA